MKFHFLKMLSVSVVIAKFDRLIKAMVTLLPKASEFDNKWGLTKKNKHWIWWIWPTKGGTNRNEVSYTKHLGGITGLNDTTAKILIEEASYFHEITKEDWFEYKTPSKGGGKSRRKKK